MSSTFAVVNGNTLSDRSYAYSALLLLLATKGLGPSSTLGYHQYLDMFLNDSYRGRTP